MTSLPLDEDAADGWGGVDPQTQDSVPTERAEALRHALVVGQEIGARDERDMICAWLRTLEFQADTPAMVVDTIAAGIQACRHGRLATMSKEELVEMAKNLRKKQRGGR